MISGMNLLGYRGRYSTKEFFHRRVLRVGGGLLFGSFVCYVLFCIFPNSFYGAERFNGVFGVKDFVKRLLTNDINDVYWFFYAIIYLYLLTPILSLLGKHRMTTRYLLFVCFISAIAIPTIERFIDARYFNSLFNWPLFSDVAVLYYVGGYYIRNYMDSTENKHHQTQAIVVAIGSLVAMIVFGLCSNGWSIISLNPSTTYDSFFISINSPFCVAFSFSFFYLFQSLEVNFIKLNVNIKRKIKVLSSLSLGIYLFHILVINWINLHLTINVLNNMFLMIPVLKAVIIYVITAALVVGYKSVYRRIGKLYQSHLKSLNSQTKCNTSEQ